MRTRRLTPIPLLALAFTFVAHAAQAQSPSTPAGPFDCVPSPDGGPSFQCTPRIVTTVAPAASQSFVLAPVAPATPAERNRFVEVMGGVLGEVVALAPAVGIAALTQDESEDGYSDFCEEDGCNDIVADHVLAGSITYLLASPFTIAAGVTLFSNADLSYSKALLGAAIGTAPGALLLLAGLGSMDGDEAAGGIMVLLSLPTLVGAPILSMVFAAPNDDEDQAARDAAAQRARFAPTASVSPDGAGGMVGLSGRF